MPISLIPRRPQARLVGWMEKEAMFLQSHGRRDDILPVPLRPRFQPPNYRHGTNHTMCGLEHEYDTISLTVQTADNLRCVKL